ncbi:hypothetical protein [Pantoea sp.]|uniref:hypothetical protein n=1 Tax=Pantoea sp. TaxID=69393 RepID=UPI00289DF924|nr:hypothetical protein [Pantoea sp.]
MWFSLDEIEKITYRSQSQLRLAIETGALESRMTEAGRMEISLQSVLSAYAGTALQRKPQDYATRRLEAQWGWLWRQSGD